MSEQCESEVAFLVARMKARAKARHHGSGGKRCWGISSDAMVLFGFGQPPPGEWDYPHDKWDLAACERTWQMAPDSLRAVMLPLLEDYRRFVRDRKEGNYVTVNTGNEAR